MGTTALEKGPRNKKKKDRNKYEQTARLHGIGSNICTRSFPSSFLVKISFICIREKNHFHTNGFALSLPLKQRLGKTRKLEAYSTQSASINTARRKKAKTAKKNTVENCGVRAERDWIYVKQS